MHALTGVPGIEWNVLALRFHFQMERALGILDQRVVSGYLRPTLNLAIQPLQRGSKNGCLQARSGVSSAGLGSSRCGLASHFPALLIGVAARLVAQVPQALQERIQRVVGQILHSRMACLRDDLSLVGIQRALFFLASQGHGVFLLGAGHPSLMAEWPCQFSILSFGWIGSGKSL